jgi:acyl-coenzyme A thioesterase PaaI-like protein
MAEGAGTRHYCFGCGADNPHGLKLDFRIENKRAVAEFQPRAEHQGYPGLVHGGLIATALDEAMGWAMYTLGVWAVTGKMEVKYRQSLPLDSKATVSGEVVRNARWLRCGEVRGAGWSPNRTAVHATAKGEVAEMERVYLGPSALVRRLCHSSDRCPERRSSEGSRTRTGQRGRGWTRW